MDLSTILMIRMLWCGTSGSSWSILWHAEKWGERRQRSQAEGARTGWPTCSSAGWPGARIVVKRLPALILHPDTPLIRLRLAEARDCELLRAWKNANKTSFFHQEDITPEQQAKWFAGYLDRQDDHVYIVEEVVEEVTEGWTPVGIVACRRQDGVIDFYNIIRGRRTGGPARMGQALSLLCSTTLRTYAEPISCKVLAENPAREWYESIGFTVEERRSCYNVLGYRKKNTT